jgi:GAF domain-containing protein
VKRRGAGDQRASLRPRKSSALTRRKTPKGRRDRNTSAANLQEQLALRTRERDEALEQQAAASEVLKVIGSSPGELQPVFDAIVQSGMGLFPGAAILVALAEMTEVRAVAIAESDPARAKAWRGRFPIPLTRQYMHGVAILDRRMLDFPDVENAPAEMAAGRQNFLASGYRAITIMPMIRGDVAIGAISLVRREPGELSDKQIAVLKNFAAQAVIAIENTRLLNELHESLEQQTATADVLRVISSSPGELEPVFQAMLANAARICEATFGNLFLCDGSIFRAVAAFHGERSDAEYWLSQVVDVHENPGIPLERLAKSKQVVHIPDLGTDASYFAKNKRIVSLVQSAGARTFVAMPMLKDGDLIGAIAMYRQEVQPFTDKQIELLKNFAAQAVIAIENTRLLNELREALQQQTATADVLQVISSSPGELEPVFQSMLVNATRICEASFGSMLLREGDRLRRMAIHNAPPEFAKFHEETPFVTPAVSTALLRVMTEKKVVHIADLEAEDPNDPIAKFAGARTILTVPLLKDNEVMGIIGIYRQEVQPFTDKQIALVQNFAAQAVIAIENTRLLNELRESLEQQTATADVLRVISSSPGELEPVFQAMLANAVRICEAKFGILNRHQSGAFPVVAMFNVPNAFVELRRREPEVRPGPSHPLARVAATKEVLQIADYKAEADYIKGEPLFVRFTDLTGARTMLVVPMLKENELVGTISIYRQEVRPFTDKQVALVQNFAAQAVIAIENTRLLNELRQSLERQTATSEVLKVISSSPGELEPVFQSMLANALRICDAKFGTLFRYDNETFETVAEFGLVPAYAEFHRQRGLFQPPVGSGLDRLLRTKDVVHIADELAEPVPGPPAKFGGGRTRVSVPMLKDNTLIGAISIYRQEVRPFTDKQIELVQNFAAQAVIAIENTRLLNELRERTGQLETQSQEVVKLNQQLEKRVADQVGEIERMGRLRRFLSPQVADLIVASGTERQLESHRREITALFCDLRGFTGFSESSDPEDVMALLREYHAAIGEIIIKYSGTLERFAGDGVMVVFNDPVPVPNPALQAVQMALDMRVAIGALIEKWRRMGHDLGFGIGISHGFATLGTIGFEGRFDYAAIGTVANVASRLCDEAKPGQILVSPRVLMAVEDAVTAELVGEFALKGIRRPMLAHNVLAAMALKI